MESDLIYRQDALDALGEEPPVWYDGEDEIAERNQWRRDVKAIKAVPSAQPEINFDEWCTDCKEYDHDKHHCPRFNKVIRKTVEELKTQSELKEIGYAECANAMLKMWIDTVLTDGEYKRIMDKLNKRWGKEGEEQNESKILD